MRLWVIVLAACVHAGAIPSAPGMGVVHHAIATSSPEAQRHFDAGLALAYGFNFDEAIFEFMAAGHADPSCAMCWWGMAYAGGPNINETDKQWPFAHELAMRAAALAKTPLEKALTDALTKRYAMAMGPLEPAKRNELQHAYAMAMRDVARQFPDDIDVMTLAAEALMIDTPPGTPGWKDGAPTSPNIPEAQALLERALAAAPNHIGAIHFYIHLVDNGPYQDRLGPYADRLGALAPGAGHLVHMASHVYLHVGRYADAEDANRRAIEADKRFLARSNPTSVYAMFAGHPKEFLWHVLLWEGERAEAVKYAGEVAESHRQMGMMGDPHAEDGAATYLPLTYIRFGMWDEALALPDPIGPSSGIVVNYARGLALVAKDKLDDAAKLPEAIRKAGEPQPAQPGGPPPELQAKHDEFRRLIADDAAAQLEAAIAQARGDMTTALERAHHAVEVEDKAPPIGEPPAWPLPARHRLGALLLAAGKADEAAQVYREDLKAHPHNGWALFGLAKALGTKQAWAEFEKAWARADVKLTASVY
jgi:tetratricopeptide (TPR) repeat protein